MPISQRFCIPYLLLWITVNEGVCANLLIHAGRKILIIFALGSYFINWKTKLYMKYIIIYEIQFLNYLPYEYIYYEWHL